MDTVGRGIARKGILVPCVSTRSLTFLFISDNIMACKLIETLDSVYQIISLGEKSDGFLTSIYFEKITLDSIVR